MYFFCKLTFYKPVHHSVVLKLNFRVRTKPSLIRLSKILMLLQNYMICCKNMGLICTRLYNIQQHTSIEINAIFFIDIISLVNLNS